MDTNTDAPKSNGSMAAIYCTNPLFRLFLSAYVFDGAMIIGCDGPGVQFVIRTADDARNVMYWLFEIDSRSALNTTHKNDWLLLVARYNEWKHK